MKMLRNPSLDELDLPAGPVLLVNAPAVDLRLPWARWLQPLGLLQLGTALQACGHDVRLIDCLQATATGRLARERAGVVELEGATINVWRFGLAPAKVARRVLAWRQEGWAPACALVSCLASTWSPGARDLVAALRTVVSGPVLLGGPYVTAYPEHAARHSGADVLVAGAVDEAEAAGRSLALYRPGALPRFAGLPLLRWTDGARVPRQADEVADEVREKAELGVTTFAFFDDCLGPGEREGLKAALERVARLGLARAGFVVVGNFSPRLIDNDLAALLQAANFRQISLHDDLEFGPAGVGCASSGDDYARGVEALHGAGYRPRTDEVSAAMVAGFPGESLQAVVARLVRLASIVGSVNLVPYQYTPGGLGSERYAELVAGVEEFADPAALNAQLYPLARRAGATIGEYWELTRLAALLNSKYRSRSFDFLGSTATAGMVRTSLAERRWDPATRKAPRELPLLPRPVGG